MKKKLIFTAFAAVAVIATTSAISQIGPPEVSSLTLANIEALTRSACGAKCPAGCSHIGWGWDKILECDCNYDHFSSCDRWGC